MTISLACVFSSVLLIEPFAQDLALCMSLVTARISDFQLEKHSNQFDPSSPSKVLVMKAWICGRTSASASGSMSSNSSGGEVSLAKKTRPLNQLVSFNMAAGTERVPWSAGLCSVLTKCHCSGLEDFLMRVTLLATYT